MPKYTFKCSSCDNILQKYTSMGKTIIECPKCDSDMARQMPITSPPDTEEVVDKYIGIKWKNDQQDLIKKRKDEYYWRVEVPRFVDSGTYSLETMLEMGWVYYNERGELQTNTKPPDKR